MELGNCPVFAVLGFLVQAGGADLGTRWYWPERKGVQQWHALALKGRRNPEWWKIPEQLETVSVSERGNSALRVIGLWMGRTLVGME